METRLKALKRLCASSRLRFKSSESACLSLQSPRIFKSPRLKFEGISSEINFMETWSEALCFLATAASKGWLGGGGGAIRRTQRRETRHVAETRMSFAH